LAVIVLLASACGGGPSGSSADGAKATGTTSVSTTVGATSTTVVAVATSAPATTAPPTTAPSAGILVFAGDYVGSTGGSGNALIKDDGSGRFDVPDLVACATCSTASAPRATINFKLTAAAPTGSGGYRGTGTITAESNPALATTSGPVQLGPRWKPP